MRQCCIADVRSEEWNSALYLRAHAAKFAMISLSVVFFHIHCISRFLFIFRFHFFVIYDGAIHVFVFLKQSRFPMLYAESSVDEQTNGFVNFRDAGLADTGTEHVFSDDFPSADSVAEGEHVHPSADGFYDSSTWKSVTTHFVGCQSFRRCYSNEKLAFFGATASNERAYCERSLNVQRQRRHSVNFSSHDQQMAYSPRDTVERLHQALLHRRKKSRLRESRRRSVVFTGSHSGVCASNAFSEGVRCGLQRVSNVTPVLDNSADPLVTSNGFGEETRSSVDFRDRITPEPCEQNKMNDQLVCGPTDHSLPTEPLLVSDTLMNSTASNPKSTLLLTEHNVTTSGFSAHPDQCTVNLSTSHILELDGE
ncbi:unnamed protein product [Dicrocoelium dendriticum]|nr:unnamed protein product [Dicrocoelium dendriticum]